MIEYLDENLGVVKVLNVTEARANFAAVLGDGSSHYIITKNNKPLRVIINHQDYLVLKQALEAKTGVVSSIPAALPQNKEPLYQKKGESRVRGLIEASLSSLPKPAQPQAVPAAKPRQAQVATQPATLPQETDNTQDADYFSQVDTVESDHQEIQAAPAPLPKPALGSREGVEIQKIMRQFIQEDKAAKPASETAAPEADMTPQQLDYYKKYKKLYESFADKEEEAPAKEGKATAQDVVTEVVAAPKTKPQQVKQVVEENYWNQNDDEVPASEPAEQAGEGGLPSLKDLLKELEEERLSDEEPGKQGLGKHDIDDLINRITNDY